MAIDAASGWVLDDLEDGQQPPAASPLHEIKLNEENKLLTSFTICLNFRTTTAKIILSYLGGLVVRFYRTTKLFSANMPDNVWHI